MQQQSIRDDLVKIRAALERMDKPDLPVSLRDFPRGACGDTCEVLAEILKELGHGTFWYVAGCRENGISHAWLQRGSTVVDITADQFDEIHEPVYLGPLNSWYQAFEVRQRHEAGYSRLDARSRAELSSAHSRVRAELNA